MEELYFLLDKHNPNLAKYVKAILSHTSPKEDPFITLRELVDPNFLDYRILSKQLIDEWNMGHLKSSPDMILKHLAPENFNMPSGIRKWWDTQSKVTDVKYITLDSILPVIIPALPQEPYNIPGIKQTQPISKIIKLNSPPLPNDLNSLSDMPPLPTTSKSIKVTPKLSQIMPRVEEAYTKYSHMPTFIVHHEPRYRVSESFFLKKMLLDDNTVLSWKECATIYNKLIINHSKISTVTIHYYMFLLSAIVNQLLYNVNEIPYNDHTGNITFPTYFKKYVIKREEVFHTHVDLLNHVLYTALPLLELYGKDFTSSIVHKIAISPLSFRNYFKLYQCVMTNKVLLNEIQTCGRSALEVYEYFDNIDEILFDALQDKLLSKYEPGGSAYLSAKEHFTNGDNISELVVEFKSNYLDSNSINTLISNPSLLTKYQFDVNGYEYIKDKRDLSPILKVKVWMCLTGKYKIKIIKDYILSPGDILFVPNGSVGSITAIESGTVLILA
jgi:hypothetical protein